MKRYIKAESTVTTFEQLAQIVADNFRDMMNEGGMSGEPFESFADMRQCYKWTSNEIKELVDEFLRDIQGVYAYIDEYDGKDVFLNGDSISYRKFSLMWKKLLQYSTDSETERDYDIFYS